MHDDELEKRFTYHKPTGDQPKHYATIRNMAKNLALYLNGICPDCRAKSIAMTKLEETVMWANKSLAEGGKDAAK